MRAKEILLSACRHSGKVGLWVIGKCTCDHIINLYLLEGDELLLGWVVVLLSELIVSDNQYAFAFSWPDTPLFIRLVSAEIPHNLYEFDCEVIEDDESGYFGGQFEEEASVVVWIQNGLSWVEVLQLFELLLSKGCLIDSAVLLYLFVEVHLKSSACLRN